MIVGPRSRSAALLPLLFVLVSALAACEPGGHFLAIDLRTDLVPGQEFDTIEVSVHGEVVESRRVGASDRFAEARRIAEMHGLAAGVHDLEVTLLHGGSTVVGRRLVLTLVERSVILVVMTRDCRGVACDDVGGEERVCLGGRCVDPTCSDLDPASCGAPECADDGECGTGAACATPACVAGVCLELGAADACAAGMVCDPDEGCVNPGDATDAGPTDSGVADTGVPPPDSGVCVPACVAGPCETASCVGGVCERATRCMPGETCCPGDVCAADCSRGPCDGRSAGEVCRPAAGDCDVAETCDGSSPLCPADALVPATLVCRSSAGPCDVEERCTGSTTTCPGDGLVPAGSECRPSGGACDPAESCTGSSAACPADARHGSSTVCRGSAGPCDVEERCDGSAAACPGNSFAPSTLRCDTAGAGGCDADDYCTGSSAACPETYLSGTVCRAAAGACNPADTCTGSSPTCPPDAPAPDGTYCNQRCGEEMCVGGACVGGMTCSAGQRCGCDEFCVCSSCGCL